MKKSMRVATRTGGHDVLENPTIQQLADQLRGTLLRPSDPEYDTARQVWNAMIDRKPALIAQVAGPADVIRTVRFARENDMLLAVKGAGHNIAGNGVCDDGLVIDLANMRSLRVDPEEKIARVEPGATLADVDHETQAFGLATPTGINSTTGISGLTLGGGFGWLSRKYGMTIDNLRSVDLVTAEGTLIQADATENEDLFWGIRGGGGNFGVVTSYEFDLHEVGPEVLAGLIVHPHSDARTVLEFMREFNANAPDELAVWAILRKAPPLPFLPESVHGTDILALAAFYAGDVEKGEHLLEPLRQTGSPIADVIATQPYAAWQKTFDPLLEPGARNYWKSHNFAELSDGAIETALKYATDLPSPQSEIFFGQLGGAAGRVDPTATAFPHREAEYVMNVHTRWEDPSQDETCITWAREFFEAMAPHATGGAYVNFISEREGEEQSAYGRNYERLVALKTEYDPTNLFQVNQNIEPLSKDVH